MAKDEQDREDLLAEATALVQRVELNVDGFVDPVVVGFRESGAASIYFGAEPVYQFNSKNELRRAYANSRLLKADRGRLIALERRRTSDQVQLVRHELDDAETDAFRAEIRQCFGQLLEALGAGRFRIVGQVPEGADVVGRACTWLLSMAGEIPLARSPRVC